MHRGIRHAGAPLLLLSGVLHAAPFPTHDQNPLLAGAGLPSSLPARLAQAGGWSAGVDVNWSSTALIQSAGVESLIVDAETREVRVSIGRALTDRFALLLEIPYRYTGAGSLDGFIDGWHDAFDLPEGARRTLPRNEMRIAYEREGAQPLSAVDSQGGLADVSLDLGYRIASTASSSVVAWLTLDLPTGEARKFTGNDAADLALALAAEHQLNARWSVFAQGGVTRSGANDVEGRPVRSRIWSGLAGVAWRASRALEFKTQLDAHSAVYDRTQLDFLSESLMLTLGGAYRFASGWRLDLAVSEDIAVESGPDVAFVIGVSRAR